LLAILVETDGKGDNMNSDNAALIESLNRQLANALALTLNYRKYHWEVTGPQFRSLHLLFEEFYNEVNDTIDELAERARMLGGLPVHSPEQIREHASITIAEPGRIGPREAVSQAHDNTHTVIREQRAAIDDASDRGDPGTADLLTRVVQIHEKHEWFLRELLNDSATLDGKLS
jgi:starvation-inducible DNA-binding protein